MTIRGTLTTTQAAELAVVAPSTIKRWADQGMLAFSRTAGGHRRFERGAVERLLLQGRDPKPDEDPFIADWVRCLVDARRHEVDSRLLEARFRLGTWCAVSDELALALAELGRRWEEGRVSIAEEHVAADCLSRSLARIGDALPTRERAARCLLACTFGDDHTLGLSMAELCLREQGWRAVWLGRHTPLAEVLRLVRANEVELVALSASTAQHDARALDDIAREAGATCEAHGVGLVLAGAGAWPAQPAHGHRIASFAAFGDYLAPAPANQRVPRQGSPNHA